MHKYIFEYVYIDMQLHIHRYTDVYLYIYVYINILFMYTHIAKSLTGDQVKGTSRIGSIFIQRSKLVSKKSLSGAFLPC